MMSEEQTMAPTAAQPRRYEQYVSFMLGGEEYGVEIGQVQEIKGWDTVTRVPSTADYVLGVVNLRGAIVPVIDLRMRFGLERVAFDSTTVIVVMRVAAQRGERIAGMVVDSVNEVHQVAADSIQPPPELMGAVDKVFIKGIADVHGKLVILLDIEKLVTSSLAAG
jgi:purine-binding chemotaxis protein CheW